MVVESHIRKKPGHIRAICTPATTRVQVVQHLRPGGIESLALDLADSVAPGHRDMILSLEGDWENGIRAWPRLEPFADRLYFAGKSQGIKPALVKRLFDYFRRHRVQVVHTHHIGPLLYAGAARLAGVPRLIHTEHDAWHLEDPRRRRLLKVLLRLLRPRLVADAEAVAASLRGHFGDLDLKVIRNGIDTARFVPADKAGARHRLGLARNAPLLGCGGRLEEVKGQRHLIEALSFMAPTVHLAVAGSGSTEAALKRRTRELGLEHRVCFLGHLDDMPSFYQALDVFCLPSLNEGLPLSTLEAQACGIPTAATDVGGCRETLCPGSGALLPPADPAGMGKILDAMLARRASRSPRAFVLQHGDLNRMKQAYRELALER